MEKRNRLTLQSAIDVLPRRPSLLIGPDATAAHGAIEHAIRTALVSVQGEDAFGPASEFSEYAAFIDQLREQDLDGSNRLEVLVRDALRVLPPSWEIQHLSRAGWSACVSVTQDLLFEAVLRDYLDSIPSSRTVTMVDHPSVQPPQRTLPVYKLLGNLNNTDEGHNLVLAASDLMVKQQQWPLLLKTFPDHVRDAPLFFVGTGSSIELVQKVLGTLLAMPKPTISSAMFLSGDATLDDATVRALLRNLKYYEVDASLKDFCSAIADFRPRQGALRSGFVATDPRKSLESTLTKYSAIVSVVPTSLPDGYEPSKHMNWLVDALFRPASIEWTPYLCAFDLYRTVSDSIKAALRSIVATPKSGVIENVVVIGEAGVGKTTTLKRVACDLAAEGIVVLWCRRSLSGNWARQFRQLSNDLSEVIRERKHDCAFLVVCDDPWALRLDASELMNCFEKFRGKIAFLFALRSSDYYTSDGPSGLAPPPPKEEIPVPFQLTAEEMDGLAEMLVKIGAAQDMAAARTTIENVPSPHARDILCSLWYLVPETQAQLTESLQDQYRRLDSVAESVSSFAQHVATASHVARRAYELVTVTSNLDIDLPVEVLVRALRIDYAEWLDMARDGRPLWGLLYDDRSDDDSTIVYRTRNEVVTQILLDLVNGGVGHAGEQSVLRELLGACDGGSPVYRNFVLDVLVRGRHKLQKILTYEQGMELFNIAQKALPYKDRVLEHHKGVWMASAGRDFKAAYAQFEKALDTPVYPGAERDAPAEHIHTSMAAAVVQMVRNGTQARDTALDVVRGHLRYASSPTFFNPHTSHVAANLLFDLSKRNGVVQQDEVGLGAIAEALEEIERALQMIGAQGRIHFKFAKDIHILDELKTEILTAAPDLETMKQVAIETYERTRAQAGFEAVARRMLTSASHQDKGRSYNVVQTYVIEIEQVLRKNGDELSTEMLVIRADLVVRWRLQRTSGSVDWSQFHRDLERILASARYRESLIKRFYLGVALFHIGDLGKARATFSTLRRSVSPMLRPNDIRCFLLGKEGSPRRLQCTFERAQGRFYATVPELRTDVPVQAPPDNVGPGATTHCYIGFSFNGPTALFRRPDDRDLMLA